MPNTFGKLFTISTWGESHGAAVGVVIDGCPPRLPLVEADIQADLDRRKPGQSAIVTPRKEPDKVEILSGVFEGRTTGAPISMLVRNSDARPGAYDEIREKFRPSHADFAYQMKYGFRDHRGGGRSSARETVGRVAAGAVAKKILSLAGSVEIRAFVARIQDIGLPPGEPRALPDACGGRRDPRPLPGSRDRGGHDPQDRGGPRRGGLGRRGHPLPGPRRPAGPRRARLRPAGGGPCEGDALPPRDQGL